MGRSVGRTVKDLQQKALGRQPLKYQFEVILRLADNIPEDVTLCSVAWERGDKVMYVDPLEVDRASSSVQFRHVMRQSTTLYKEGSRLLPAASTFKLQAASTSKGRQSQKSFGRVQVDMSEYCSSNAVSETRDVVWEMQPAGRLYVTISSTWLQLESESAYAAGQAASGSQCQTSEMSYSSVDPPSISSMTDDLEQGATSRACDQHSTQHAGPVASLGRRISSATSSSPQQPSPRHRRLASSSSSQFHSIQEDQDDDLQQGSHKMQLQQRQQLSSLIAAPAAAATSPTGMQQEEPAAGSSSVPAADALEDRSSFSCLLSNSIPQWMWPTGCSTVEGLTTEQIMQHISSGSVVQLQTIARGLLVERNDWRREAAAAQQQVATLQAQAQQLTAQCRELEGTVQQLQEHALVDALVAVKLQLAQAELAVAASQGDLSKERQKNRALSGRLPALEGRCKQLALANEALQQQVQQQVRAPIDRDNNNAAAAAAVAAVEPMTPPPTVRQGPAAAEMQSWGWAFKRFATARG